MKLYLPVESASLVNDDISTGEWLHPFPAYLSEICLGGA